MILIMNNSKNTPQPDKTAVRTALWRALHIQADAEPHIIKDEVGLKLIDPPAGWQERPDMKYTKRLRASVAARARFIEDLIIDESKRGISQYVILGSGLDTFAQRNPDIASGIQIFEIDQAETLKWKQQRLAELGFGVPNYIHFVPVDFERESWFDELLKSKFDKTKPAFVSCTGVSLYLTKAAILSTLKKIVSLASGSKLAMSFYLPIELLDEEDKPMQEIAVKGAREAGTPMISFFTNDEILALADEAGFKKAELVTTKDMIEKYFLNRTDNLMPASGEVILAASV
jgi:methyltransferase (TIGR00027 family)